MKHAPHSSQMWQDRERLDFDWDPPRWYDRYSPRTRLLAALVVLALLVVGLGLSGGFRTEPPLEHTDFRVPQVTGPYEVTIQRAIYDTVQSRVAVEATCRLVDDQYMAVPTEPLRVGMAIIIDRRIVPFRDRWASFDVSEHAGLGRDALSPGTPAMPCTISAKVPKGFQPPAHVHVGIMRQHYDGGDQVQKGGRDWRLGRGGVVVKVPLTILR